MIDVKPRAIARSTPSGQPGCGSSGSWRTQGREEQLDTTRRRGPTKHGKTAATAVALLSVAMSAAPGRQVVTFGTDRLVSVGECLCVRENGRRCSEGAEKGNGVYNARRGTCLVMKRGHDGMYREGCTVRQTVPAEEERRARGTGRGRSVPASMGTSNDWDESLTLTGPRYSWVRLPAQAGVSVQQGRDGGPVPRAAQQPPPDVVPMMHPKVPHNDLA